MRVTPCASSFILCASLAVVFALWILMFIWRWDVPVSLMILRPAFLKTAARGGGASTAEGAGAARTAAAGYAAKHLQ